VLLVSVLKNAMTNEGQISYLKAYHAEARIQREHIAKGQVFHLAVNATIE
jgi:hypothetical protein